MIMTSRTRIKALQIRSKIKSPMVTSILKLLDRAILRCLKGGSIKSTLAA